MQQAMDPLRDLTVIYEVADNGRKTSSEVKTTQEDLKDLPHNTLRAQRGKKVYKKKKKKQPKTYSFRSMRAITIKKIFLL